MTPDSRRPGGLLLVLLSTVCLSVAPTLVKLGLAAAVDPVTLIAMRLIVAAAAFWVAFPIVWPDALRIDRRGLARCAAVAVANSISLLCFYLALTRIEASVAHMIFSLYPLVALVLLAGRGERITRRSLARLGLGLLGVYLLVGLGGRVDLLGASLVVGTAVAYALHMTLIQWYLGDYPSQTVALYVVSLMALILTAVRLLQFRPWQPLSPVGWGVVLVTALVSTVLARLALFAGIQRIGSGQAALFGPIETLLTVLWAFLFLGERLSPVQWAGGLSILLSAMLLGGRSDRARPRSRGAQV